MSVKDVKNIIALIPDILVYIVPGALFLYIFYFICSKENDKETESHFLFKSIILSFVLTNFVKLCGKPIIWILSLQIKKQFVVPSFLKVSSIILFSIVSSYLFSIFYKTKFLTDILKKFGVTRSVHKNCWNEVADSELGMWVRVYIPSEKVVYCGKLRKYEEKDDNYLFFLSNYNSYTYDNKDIDDFGDADEKWVALNIKDTSRIELFYSKQSSKIQ